MSRPIFTAALLTLGACATDTPEAPPAAPSNPAPSVAAEPVASEPATPTAAADSLVFCTLSGSAGSVASCPVHLSYVPGEAPVALQLDLAFDTSQLRLAGFSCRDGSGADPCASGALPSGHSLRSGSGSADVQARVLAVNFGGINPMTGAVAGDGQTKPEVASFSLQFALHTDMIDAAVTVGGVILSDAVGQPLSVSVSTNWIHAR
jgi:hypothetical protein